MLTKKFTSFLAWAFFIVIVDAKIYLVRITGGRASSIRLFPYHVALEHNGEYHCGGVIVSTRNVLTAAHCFDHIDTSKLTIRSGTPFRERGGIVHRVQNFTRHPEFHLNLFDNAHSDIAVIRVVEPFVYDSYHRNIELFEKGEVAKPGDTAFVTGWGGTETCDESDRIRSVRIPIVNRTKCNSLYQAFGGINAGEICAGEVGVGSWHGDSGGPLAVGERLAGIVSYGEGCKVPKYPGVYSEIGFFRDWIDQYVEYDPAKPH